MLNSKITKILLLCVVIFGLNKIVCTIGNLYAEVKNIEDEMKEIIEENEKEWLKLEVEVAKFMSEDKNTESFIEKEKEFAKKEVELMEKEDKEKLQNNRENNNIKVNVKLKTNKIIANEIDKREAEEIRWRRG